MLYPKGQEVVSGENSSESRWNGQSVEKTREIMAGKEQEESVESRQKKGLLLLRRIRDALAKKPTDSGPEAIARMGIVKTLLAGFHRGEGAQNQYFGPGVVNGSESVLFVRDDNHFLSLLIQYKRL